MKYVSRVIIACDFASREELFEFLEKFGDKKLFLKLGLEIIYAEGFKLIEDLKRKGHQIFLDLKLHDIPNTALKAVKSLAKYNPELLTVHTLGGLEMLQAVNSVSPDINIVGVTLLTSHAQEDLCSIGIDQNIESAIDNLMFNSQMAGLKYVVCSAHEVKLAKKYNLTTVVPGIRIEGDNSHDQARIVSPEVAFELGSDLVVVGRSITKAKDPVAVLEYIEKVSNERSR